MVDMAILTQSFPIRGVEDERKQLLNFSFMVSLVRGIAATLTETVSGSKDLNGPSSPSRMVTDDGGQVLNCAPLPVRVSLPPEILRHPFPLAGLRAEMILRRMGDACRGAAHYLAALIAGDVYDGMAPAPPFGSAAVRAVLAGARTGCWLQWLPARAAGCFTRSARSLLIICLLFARGGAVDLWRSRATRGEGALAYRASLCGVDGGVHRSSIHCGGYIIT